MQSFQLLKPIRTGFIGLGDHANEQLLPSLMTIPNVELTIISSRTASKLELFGQKFKPKYTTQNWEEIINPSLIDAVIVCSKPQIHYEVAKKCLENGIHIFIEKPPTQNIHQLQELIELKKKTNCKTFVGYNFTFSEAFQKLQKTLSNSRIKLAKFRFLVGKLNEPVDGFETVLESNLYKMFIHPVHTLISIFGPYIKLQLFEQILPNNKFSMQVIFEFSTGLAILDWGNYSNRFECRFELTNQTCETGILDNMNHLEFWNLQDHKNSPNFIKEFKSKEKLVWDYSPLSGGFERTGYQFELGGFFESITQNKSTNCELEQSLEVYRAIEEVQNKSKIDF
jgi:phthalate 4,5-cis-dihydrodiol dehydrogenase